MDLTSQEQQWLATQRGLQRRVFVGIDYHSVQLTVAMATGEMLRQRPAPARIPIRRFRQDGLGYRELLTCLDEQFPQANRSDFFFVAEPTFAQPLGYFLRQQGFAPQQILWVKTNKVAQYRKAHDLSAAGKNDDQDARTMLLMGFDGVAEPGSRLHLFPAVAREPRQETLRQLAAAYQRLTEQSGQLQNVIFNLVLRLFPEVGLVFSRREHQQRQDGTAYTVDVPDFFTSETPMRLLSHFPTPAAVLAAGFEQVWARVGRRGVRRAKIHRLMELARVSGGVPDDLAAERLTLWIAEYQELQARLANYRSLMCRHLEQDPVMASFLSITALNEVMLATVMGAVGTLADCPSADHLKSYLNVAPKPMPQTATVDAQGRLVQTWRMPANTYKVINGQRRLVYEIPGQKAPRLVLWLWFDLLVRGSHQRPADPFVQLYQRYKARLQGQPRWYGRVRWKMIGKLITVMYACLKSGQPYDPATMSHGDAQMERVMA